MIVIGVVLLARMESRGCSKGRIDIYQAHLPSNRFVLYKCRQYSQVVRVIKPIFATAMYGVWIVPPRRGRQNRLYRLLAWVFKPQLREFCSHLLHTAFLASTGNSNSHIKTSTIQQ